MICLAYDGMVLGSSCDMSAMMGSSASRIFSTAWRHHLVEQILFVTVMLVEGIAADLGPIAGLLDGDRLELLLAHQIEKRVLKSFLHFQNPEIGEIHMPALQAAQGEVQQGLAIDRMERKEGVGTAPAPFSMRREHTLGHPIQKRNPDAGRRGFGSYRAG